MNEEERLSGDELEAIREGYPVREMPSLPEVLDYGLPTMDTIAMLITQVNVRNLHIDQLLQHIRAIENELAIERAQAARGDWFAKP